jgi:TonB family protein
MSGMNAYDTVRLISIPPDLHNDEELRTPTLFQKCLGQSFVIAAVESFDVVTVMRTITNVIVGLAFLFSYSPIQAQKNQTPASHPVSPAGLTGLPFAEVMLDSPGLVATKIVLAHYTLPSPDPNLNDTFLIKMRVTISEGGDVETAKVTKYPGGDHGADELYAPALEAIRQWKFEPYAKKGHAKKVTTTFFLRFVPDDRISLDGMEHKSGGVAGQPIEMTYPETMSTITRLVIPAYPKEAMAMRLSGLGFVDIIIGKNGEVVDIRKVKAHPLIADATVYAIRQWRFEPHKLNGEPIEVSTEVQILFDQTEP